MNDNPWRDLPKKPPFVLDEDYTVLHSFSILARGHFGSKCHTDLIPEPFIGRPDAPILLLGNNPGVKNDAAKEWKLKPEFQSRMRANLAHKLSVDFPFLLLDPDLEVSPPAQWWFRKLKHLLDECGRSLVARSIFAVDYFPYVSRRYRHYKFPLPSQQYSFGLVGKAVARGAVIVLTRGIRRWEATVPELRKYSRCFRVKEVQRAPISPGNFTEPEHFEEIVRAMADS
jgi:hypothetical protein